MDRPLFDLSKKIVAVNKKNGWNITTPGDWRETDYKIPAILALIHSEVSEALEAFRKNDWSNFSEELADIIIRVLDCSGGLGIDIDSAVEEKIEKNKLRGFRHGGKRV
jgi:NTP pyrophosphatase (non-canonical NTP hydrolase)